MKWVQKKIESMPTTTMAGSSILSIPKIQEQNTIFYCADTKEPSDKYLLITDMTFAHKNIVKLETCIQLI